MKTQFTAFLMLLFIGATAQTKIDTVLVHKWDMLIAFPTCTYLTVTANRWMKDMPGLKSSGSLVGEDRRKARQDAIDFFLAIANADIPRIAIENPVGVMSTEFRSPDQIVQPYYFGDPFRKKTCLWLKGLPPLFHAKNHDLFTTQATHVNEGESYNGLTKKERLKDSHFGTH